MIQALKNKWIRWIAFIVAGILIRFFLDVVYSLMYRTYTLFQPFDSYFYTVGITFLVFEAIYRYRQRLERTKMWEAGLYSRFLKQWSVSLGFGIFVVFVLRWVVIMLTGGILYVGLIDELIILLFVIFVITTLTVFDLGFFLLNRWRFSLAELERFKKENAEFRFESLRSQVNPHFLFNSLNTLATLIYENQEKAELFIRELSDVYRYVLENRGEELVPLNKELKMARSYIYLQQLRFEENLTVNIEIGETAKQKMIAPLTLQLLIENAVKHNVISRKKPLRIDIFSENEYLVVDNNLQTKETKEYSSELGLKNIINRYNYLTGIKVEIIESEKFFKVKIPLI